MWEKILFITFQLQIMPLLAQTLPPRSCVLKSPFQKDFSLWSYMRWLPAKHEMCFVTDESVWHVITSVCRVQKNKMIAGGMMYIVRQVTRTLFCFAGTEIVASSPVLITNEDWFKKCINHRWLFYILFRSWCMNTRLDTFFCGPITDEGGGCIPFFQSRTMPHCHVFF